MFFLYWKKIMKFKRQTNQKLKVYVGLIKKQVILVNGIFWVKVAECVTLLSLFILLTIHRFSYCDPFFINENEHKTTNRIFKKERYIWKHWINLPIFPISQLMYFYSYNWININSNKNNKEQPPSCFLSINNHDLYKNNMVMLYRVCMINQSNRF